MAVRRVAVFSMHTSPLAQPGAGDGGGMNVYVRALAGALARAGVECDVYTRAEHTEQPTIVKVEPGFRVLHVDAGPREPVPKHELPALVDPFVERRERDARRVAARRRAARELLALGRGRAPVEARARPAARRDVPHARARQGRRRYRRRSRPARAHRARRDRVRRPDARVDRRRARAARVAVRRGSRSHRDRAARCRPQRCSTRRRGRGARRLGHRRAQRVLLFAVASSR